MQVAETSIDASQATSHLAEYYGAVRGNESPDSEFSQVIRGLEAAAEGARIIHLSNSIRACPRDEKGRPRLAIARADRTQVRFSWSARSQFASFDAAQRRATSVGPTLTRTVDMGGPHGIGDIWKTITGFALVPLVPPRALPPGGRSALHRYYTLWEVESWSDTRISPEPPRDPYLLTHIAGDLYRVDSEWDLTELERWVTAARGTEGG